MRLSSLIVGLVWGTFAVGCADPGPASPTVNTDCLLDGARLEQGAVRVDDARCRTCTCTAAGLDCVQRVDCAVAPPEPEVDPRVDCAVGAVTGRACSPDGAGIPGATITAATTDCTGQARIAIVEADHAGHFRLPDLVPGATTITITAGRFESRHQVTVEADRALPLDGTSDKTCIAADAAKLAVIGGDYDAIEDVLGRLGFEYDLYCGADGHTWPARQLLGDWSRLSQYDVVFINCGAHIDLRRAEIGRQMGDNLRRFVAEGGSVYASDLAAGVVDRLWSGAVGFDTRRRDAQATDACCRCIDCPAQCGFDDCVDCCGVPAVECRESPTLGAGDLGAVSADVVNGDLAAFLGAAQLQITFDLAGWVEITGVSVATDVLVRSRDRPLMVLFDAGENGGRVAYTSFHNQAQVSAEVELLLRALIFQL